MKRIVIATIMCSTAHAVETGPYKVLYVPDAQTVNVQSPDEDEPERVSLRWITLPEKGTTAANAINEEAVKALRVLLPAGTMITLVAPEKEVPRDKKGRLQALVVIKDGGVCVQDSVIRAGWALCGGLPETMKVWNDKLSQAASAAKEAHAGAWKLDETWMTTMGGSASSATPAPVK